MPGFFQLLQLLVGEWCARARVLVYLNRTGQHSLRAGCGERRAAVLPGPPLRVAIALDRLKITRRMFEVLDASHRGRIRGSPDRVDNRGGASP